MMGMQWRWWWWCNGFYVDDTRALMMMMWWLWWCYAIALMMVMRRRWLWWREGVDDDDLKALMMAVRCRWWCHAVTLMMRCDGLVNYMRWFWWCYEMQLMMMCDVFHDALELSVLFRTHWHSFSVRNYHGSRTTSWYITKFYARYTCTWPNLFCLHTVRAVWSILLQTTTENVDQDQG